MPDRRPSTPLRARAVMTRAVQMPVIAHGSPRFENRPSVAHVLKGPGKFVSAQISKQGGTNDITFVILEIDGKTIVNGSMAGYRNRGQTQSNPSGSMLLQSSTQRTVTVGFPFPLAYQSELRLWVDITEPGVLQIQGTVIHGE